MEEDSYYIVNTEMAGVWFGKFVRNHAGSACLTEGRRIFDTAETSLTLNEIANIRVGAYDKIMSEKPTIWLIATEYELCTTDCITSIQSKSEYLPDLSETSSDIDYDKAKELIRAIM